MKAMLSVFPELLFLAPFSAFLLRIALGIVFAYAAWIHFNQSGSTSRSFAFVEGLLAFAFVAGAWIQPAAILGGLIIALWLAFPKLRTASLGTILLSLVISITLLVSGAGPFAFDLPL